MPSLQIRDLDEETYEGLRAAARRERRSLAQQAAVTLRRAVAEESATARERRAVLLRAIADAAAGFPRDLPDPARLVREDRDR